MKCLECKLDMPPRYLHSVFTSRGILTQRCPECIRQIIGKIHEVENYQFTGKQAQYNLKEFLEWRKRNEQRGLQT